MEMKQTKLRIKILTEWLQILLGLLVFAYGVHLTINADIGLGPWDCLGMGVSYHTPFNFGISMTIISVCLLVIDLIMKEKIGWGTIIDALVTGNLTQFFNSFDPIPPASNMAAGIVMMLIGVTLMAIGQFIYMRTAHGCGPRDSFLIAVGKRMKKVPVGVVQVIILAVVLFFGWLLGGKVGIGTLINVVGTGVMMQIVFRLVHFEPRKVAHRSVISVSKTLFTTHFPGTDRTAYGSAGITFISEYFSARYGQQPVLKSRVRLPVICMSNTALSRRGVIKNCSVASAARILFYWKQQGIFETEDTIQEIYEKAEAAAFRHGYHPKRGIRAFRIDDMFRDVLQVYGYQAASRPIYGWSFEKDLKPELDAGRPVILNIAGGYYHNHSVTVLGYRIYQPGDKIFLTIADGWKAMPRYIDLYAFNREFPLFGISSLNTMQILEGPKKADVIS